MNLFVNKPKKEEESKEVNPDGIDVFLDYKSNLKIDGGINISTKNFERKNTKPKANIVDTKNKNKNTNIRKLF